MAVDHIRYDVLVQEALRGMVRDVLAETASKGLVGDHHFFITFHTASDGVELSDRLRAQYPEEMTIVLQHQFWDLKVGEKAFDVGLSFSGIPERLRIPFAAIKAFTDPSVQFTLQFDALIEAESEDRAGQDRGRRPQAGVPARPEPAAVPPPAPKPEHKAEQKPKPPRDKGPDQSGAEVVPLDRFRKK